MGLITKCRPGKLDEWKIFLNFAAESLIQGDWIAFPFKTMGYMIISKDFSEELTNSFPGIPLIIGLTPQNTESWILNRQSFPHTDEETFRGFSDEFNLWKNAISQRFTGLLQGILPNKELFSIPETNFSAILRKWGKHQGDPKFYFSNDILFNALSKILEEKETFNSLFAIQISLANGSPIYTPEEFSDYISHPKIKMIISGGTLRNRYSLDELSVISWDPQSGFKMNEGITVSPQEINEFIDSDGHI